MADKRNAGAISTGKLLKCGRLEEEKEMENDFSFNLYRIVCYAWR
jgi:hypothetical protein